MKTCKSCQTQIDEKAKKCPNCRADQRGWFRRHPILTALLVLFVIGIVGGAAGGGKSTTTDSTAPKAEDSSSNSETQQEEAPTATAVEATDFIAEFDKNQLAAEEKYKDKLVEFSAVIDNISEDVLGTAFLSLKPTAGTYFKTSIKCNFAQKSELTGFSKEQTITLQGTVTGQTLGIISLKDCKAK